jgi:hypothetical protein
MDISEDEFRLNSPLPLNADGLWGQYCGVLSLKGQPHGQGMLLSPDGRKLYEGVFVEGVKHGSGRYITASFSTPHVKVKEGSYNNGIPDGLFTVVRQDANPIGIIDTVMKKLVQN